MYIFDSVKKEKVEFIPQDKNNVKMYVCGPTVYDDAHLGHAKSSLSFDLLYRVLEANAYDVTYAKNITDIDDKIIKKAQELNKTIDQISSEFTDAYHKDMDALYIKRPNLEPRATESLEAMYSLINSLIEKEHAYVTKDGDVYFDTKSDKSYLSISNQRQDEDSTQARVESSSLKRNNTDFALWKSAKDNEVSFEAPYSKGRPGWHLECSAMIEKHLADENLKYSVDIHGGGADLLFPHHENEAAQTRCSSSHELAAYWVHNGFVTVNNEKMSKSLGNSFFIKDALKKYDGEVLRYYLLSSHYRANFNFSEEDLLVSKKRLDKIYRLKKRLFGMGSKDIKTTFKDELLKALNDDLNTSVSYALIDEMISSVNDTLDNEPKNKLIKKEAMANLMFIENILGFASQNPFEYFQYGIDENKKNMIDTLIEKRAEAKKDKNFELSDQIRDEILALDVSIMDTANGTFWESN